MVPVRECDAHAHTGLVGYLEEVVAHLVDTRAELLDSEVRALGLLDHTLGIVIHPGESLTDGVDDGLEDMEGSIPLAERAATVRLDVTLMLGVTPNRAHH